MTWPRCCVENCGENKKLRFRFPHPYSDRNKRFGEWLKRIGDEKLNALDPMVVYRNKRICFKHFSVTCYVEGTQKLKRDAIPTRFPRSPAVVAVTGGDGGSSSMVNPVEPLAVEAVTGGNGGSSSMVNPVEPLAVETVTGGNGGSSSMVNPVEPLAVETVTGGNGGSSSMVNPVEPLAVETVTGGNGGSSSMVNPVEAETPMRHPSTPQKSHRQREGVLQRIGVRKAISLTPKARSLYNTNKLLRKAASRSSKKLLSFRQRLQAAEEGLNRGVGALDTLPQTVSSFVQCQVSQYQKRSKGRRFSLDYKVWSLSLMKRSGRAYDYLSKAFVLPSRKTLQRLLSRLSFSTGINDAMFNHLSVTVEKSVKAIDRHCIVMFDEMSLTPHLDFHEHLDYIEGFVDLGGEKRSRAFADKALVYMVRGLKRKYKQPVAYVFHSGSANALELSHLLSAVIGRVQQCGLKVTATICDQAPTNCSLVNILCANTRAAVLRRGEEYRGDYFCVNDMKIIPLYDPPHLLKGIRNGLLTKDLKFTLGGVNGIASWRHVLQVYSMDCGERRYVPRLTDFHVVPEKIRKMKVKYCTQVLSDRLSVVMKLSSAIPNSGVEPQAAETSVVLSFFDKLFDSVNGRLVTPPPEKPLLCAVSSSSGHMEFWAEAIKVLESMEYTCSNKVLTSKERKTPSLVNWARTLRNIRDLWVSLRSQGMKHLSLRNLNQDPLENKFGCIRSYGFRNNYPTCTNFVGAYKSLILNDMVSAHSVGANCEEDDCEVLDNLKSFLVSSGLSDPSTSSSPGPNDNSGEEGVIIEPIGSRASSSLGSTISDISAENLLRKLGRVQCAECLLKQCATVQVPNFQGRVAPSKEFSDIYEFATRLIHRDLPDLAHRLGVGSTLRSMLLRGIDFRHIACDEHHASYGQKFCKLVVNATVTAWCNSVNSYLCGKRTQRTEAMDIIHLLALQYFSKKRGGHR